LLISPHNTASIPQKAFDLAYETYPDFLASVPRERVSLSLKTYSRTEKGKFDRLLITPESWTVACEAAVKAGLGTVFIEADHETANKQIRERRRERERQEQEKNERNRLELF
jgi:hypothetical protein